MNVGYEREIQITIPNNKENNNEENNTAKRYAKINETFKYWKGDGKSEISRIEIQSERNSGKEEGRPRDADHFTQRAENAADSDNAQATTMAERHSLKRKLLREEEKEIRERIQRKNEKRKRRGKRVKRIQLLREYEARISTDSEEQSSSEEDDAEHSKTIKVISDYEKRRSQDLYQTDTYTVSNDKGEEIAIINNIISIRNLTPLSDKNSRGYSIKLQIQGDEIKSREIVMQEEREDGTSRQYNAVQIRQREFEIKERDPKEVFQQIMQIPSTSETQIVTKINNDKAIEAAIPQGKSKVAEILKKTKRRGRPRKESVSETKTIVEEKKKTTSGRNLSKKECKKIGITKKYARTLSSSSSDSSEDRDPTYDPFGKEKTFKKSFGKYSHDSELTASISGIESLSAQNSQANLERRLKPEDEIHSSSAFEIDSINPKDAQQQQTVNNEGAIRSTANG